MKATETLSTPPSSASEDAATTPPGPQVVGQKRTSRSRHADFRRLLTERGFRRLLATRFAAQWGDGLFQAGLGGAVLFNPEREADPAVVAAGLAVLLLPYSVIGPFAGALLDRWDRRRVLVVANLLRGLLVLATAAAVGAGVTGPLLYGGALLVTGVSRFVGAGLSASLPHVVDREHLVEANALATTLGAVVAASGGASAIALRAVFGADDNGSALVTGTALLGSLLAALIAARFAHGQLGPDEFDEPAETVVAVARGLLDGARAALAAPAVAAGFVGLIAHRLAFGASTLVGLLLMRYAFTDIGPFRAGMAGVGEAVAAGAAGILAAALIAPGLVARFGRRRVVAGSLLSAAAVQLLLGTPLVLPALLVATFGVACAGQVVKLCVDAAVQSDVGDEVRGRVFALYDTLFNVVYVLAVAGAAALVPPDGRSRGLIVAAGVVYLLGAVGYLLVTGAATRRRTTRDA